MKQAHFKSCFLWSWLLALDFKFIYYDYSKLNKRRKILKIFMINNFNIDYDSFVICVLFLYLFSRNSYQINVI